MVVVGVGLTCILRRSLVEDGERNSAPYLPTHPTRPTARMVSG